MGIAEQLSYRHVSANRVQRMLQALVASRGGAWVFARVLPTLDSWVQRATHQRHTVPSLLAGLPVVDLTTTGRKSGQQRTAHLIGIPYGDTLALLGTNFGQAHTPAWVLNLEAQPLARLDYRGARVEVSARAADEQESAQVIAASADYYVGYRKYQTRISGRRLRIFILDPA